MSKQKPVLVIGDTHAPAMLDGYISFLKKIYKKHGCGRVVHIGDLVDWNSISFHEKDPSMPSPVEEFNRAFKQVQKLYKAFPKVDYMIGNHSSLPARKARMIGLPNDVMKSFKDLWQVNGWTIHSRYADLEIDRVIYRHGDKGKGGHMAAHKNAISEFKSVVQGHLHAQAGVVYHANQGECIFGMQVGCGVDHSNEAMAYGRVYANKPIVGCGVVYSSKLAFFEPMFL
jgi:predicted phosphodiesterase